MNHESRNPGAAGRSEPPPASGRPPPAAVRHPLVKVFDPRRSHAYGGVLLLVLVSLVFTLGAPDAAAARVVTVALLGLTLLVAESVSESVPWLRWATLAIVALSLVVTVAAVTVWSDAARSAGMAAALCFAVLAPLTISRGVVRDMKATRRVTLRAVFGVVSVYILLGFLFAFAGAVIAELDGGEYLSGVQAGATIQDFLYFSFITLTTVGYGDIVPATELARMLAIVEALLGQIYLVTIVALLVSNVGRGRGAAARRTPANRIEGQKDA